MLPISRLIYSFANAISATQWKLVGKSIFPDITYLHQLSPNCCFCCCLRSVLAFLPLRIFPLPFIEKDISTLFCATCEGHFVFPCSQRMSQLLGISVGLSLAHTQLPSDISSHTQNYLFRGFRFVRWLNYLTVIVFPKWEC